MASRSHFYLYILSQYTLVYVHKCIGMCIIIEDIAVDIFVVVFSFLAFVRLYYKAMLYKGCARYACTQGEENMAKKI